MSANRQETAFCRKNCLLQTNFVIIRAGLFTEDGVFEQIKSIQAPEAPVCASTRAANMHCAIS